METTRLQSLERYDLLDTPSEDSFDRLTRLARRIFDLPFSSVSILDAHRQWFKSHPGFDVSETARSDALCDLVVRERRALVVLDTFLDERFRSSALVVGEPHIRFYAGVPLSTLEGDVLGTFCIMDVRPRELTRDQLDTLFDLGRITMDQLELRRIAAVDTLTGALTRRAFRDQAERLLGLAVRHRHVLSCLSLDIDHFKAINDRFGHAAGDRVLVAVVVACRNALRETDLIGRLGGEEFAILLPNTGAKAALAVAEKLRAAIEKVSVDAEGERISVTACFGVASLEQSARDLDTLLERADKAMCRAKQEGRNRCAMAVTAAADAPPSMRRRVLKAGRIAFNGGHSTVDCTIRSLSDQEAGLDVISAAGIPDEFKLRIDSDDLSRLCRVKARNDRHIEVVFE